MMGGEMNEQTLMDVLDRYATGFSASIGGW